MGDVQLFLLDAEYREPFIVLSGVNQNGSKVAVSDRSVSPYFYLEPREDADRAQLQHHLAAGVGGIVPGQVEAVERKLLGQPKRLLQVTFDRQDQAAVFWDAAKRVDEVKAGYEYGMPLYKRYLIDKGLQPAGWLTVKGDAAGLAAQQIVPADRKVAPRPHIMAFDIEVAEENGEERIIMASLADTEGLSKLLTYAPVSVPGAEVLDGEKALLERFAQLVRDNDPAIITGYNTDRYDFPKLLAAAARHGIQLRFGKDDMPVLFVRRGRITAARLPGLVHIDTYSFVENVMAPNLESETLTLDMVAKELLGAGKQQMKWIDIQRAWREQRGLEQVAEYCKTDSQLALRLAERLLPLLFSLSQLTGQLPFDVCRMAYSQLVEGLLVRKAYANNEIVLNRPRTAEVKRRRAAASYKGGYVHLPEKGMHDNIAVFDFQSLYPSIILTHNVSPDTICQHPACRSNTAPESEHQFCLQQKGFMPGVLEAVVKKRLLLKKARGKAAESEQLALKILANAFYGYYGYAGSRWYSRLCAEAITAWGRRYIKGLIATAEGMGLPVIYGDTDSIFLSMEAKKDARRFVAAVNKKLPGTMELEFKGFYKRGIFIQSKAGSAAKKKYALLEANGNLVMRGMETRRRDWAKIARDTQEAVLRAILQDRSPEKAIGLVRAAVARLRSGSAANEEVIIFSQVTKPLAEYEQESPHLSAARKLQQLGGRVAEGTVIGYIITKGAGTISERAAPADFAQDYDPEYYVRNQVVPAALRILGNLGVTESDILSDGDKQFSLAGFWKKR
ncbi:MAG: hypothetical protein HY519_00920 [Candidatus Aenigmarchaeota archaeon]|nr:hypothetical protein [Candidatus Aenigmarchaeota archaeon]